VEVTTPTSLEGAMAVWASEGSEVPKKPGNARGGKGTYFWMCFGRRRGRVVGDEPGNTDCDPETAEKALSEGDKNLTSASLCSTTRSIAKIFCDMPMNWRKPSKERREWTDRPSR
jgi:hypothetical protein